MLFAPMKRLAFGASLLLAPTSFAVGAEPVLAAKPDRCVALHQGQVCYQTVRFVWRALDPVYDYCLLESPGGAVVHCWLGGRTGEITFEFGSAQSQVFELKRSDGELISEVEIVVAWVYKSSRKRSSGWRLF